MTYREKLTIEHPHCVGPENIGGCEGCPSSYDYAPARVDCNCGRDHDECTKCWDQEIPDMSIDLREVLDNKSPIFSLNHTLIAKVVTNENKYMIEEIKRWAKEKGNITVVEMDEDRLMKIIELGSRELERLEKEHGANIF